MLPVETMEILDELRLSPQPTAWPALLKDGDVGPGDVGEAGEVWDGGCWGSDGVVPAAEVLSLEGSA